MDTIFLIVELVVLFGLGLLVGFALSHTIQYAKGFEIGRAVGREETEGDD